MIGRGVPAGAIRPNQMLVSESGTPASAMVGRAGAVLGRLLAAEASALSLPALTCGITAEAGENITETRPASRSVTACGLPWYGTCTSLMPARALNSSPARRGAAPTPVEA